MSKAIAWGCWIYGKFMKWAVIYPLWLLWKKIRSLEIGLYLHTRSIRQHWDTYMFNKQLDGL